MCYHPWVLAGQGTLTGPTWHLWAVTKGSGATLPWGANFPVGKRRPGKEHDLSRDERQGTPGRGVSAVFDAPAPPPTGRTAGRQLVMGDGKTMRVGFAPVRVKVRVRVTIRVGVRIRAGVRVRLRVWMRIGMMIRFRVTVRVRVTIGVGVRIIVGVKIRVGVRVRNGVRVGCGWARSLMATAVRGVGPWPHTLPPQVAWRIIIVLSLFVAASFFRAGFFLPLNVRNKSVFK